MDRKLTPIQHLWILFSLQLVIFVALLVLFAFFEPRFDHLVSQAKDASAKMPILKQRIDQADLQTLHKDALLLLDESASQSFFVQTMETNVMRILAIACFVFGLITCWLGVITFRLHQGSENKL